MRLYFVRHGESVANCLHEFSNRGWKHPLTETGIDQAHRTAQRLLGLSVAQIYSSPLMRAVQTAQILADTLHAPLEVTEALREWDVGMYEGTTDPVGWDLHRQVQEDWFMHQAFDSKMPGGESFYDIQARFVPFVEQVTQDFSNTDQNIVLVAHGGLYSAMLPLIFKNLSWAIAQQYPFIHAAYVLAETRTDGLYCLSWCDIPLEL